MSGVDYLSVHELMRCSSVFKSQKQLSSCIVRFHKSIIILSIPLPGSMHPSQAVTCFVLGRKQLLNKCQEEFEKGAAAMEAVEAREKANEGKPADEDDKDQAEVLSVWDTSCWNASCA